MFRLCIIPLLAAIASIANAADDKDLAAFRQCVIQASALEGELAEFKRHKSMLSAGVSGYVHSEVNAMGKKLRRKTIAFNSDCGERRFDVSPENGRGMCAHPAYQSAWCDGFDWPDQ